MNKRFLIANILLCIVLAFSLIYHWFSKSAVLTIIVSFIATATVLFSAFYSLRYRKFSIDFLAGIALVVAMIEREWVSAVFINLMIAFARAFIDYVKIKSHSALSGLMKLKPETARIKIDGRTKEIPIESVKKEDLLVVDLGEMIPVDGIVKEGEAMVDQSSLTGESIPVLKKKGDVVLSFTAVVSGNLIVKAEKVGKETSFEKVITLIEKSQMSKAPINTLLDKFANWYVILTLFGSLVVYLITRNVNLVLGILLVSCADDIAVATPLALMTAIVHSAKHGAIIKGGDFLEALAKLKVIIFDKTGTLTKGKLKVEKVVTFKKEDVLKLAGIASYFSNHPVSKAILKASKDVKEPTEFNEFSGKGMTAVYRKKHIAIGKIAFFKELKIEISKHQREEIEKEEEKGFNVTLVSLDNQLIGYICLFDELRPKLKQINDSLRKLGIKKIVMLTGDNEKIARNISEMIGVDEFHANLLPEGKLKYLEKYLDKKHKVAMVGDGVNDAPVLAMSDIGIAMGAIGSDSAIEAADIAMMKDDLSQIPEILKIGKATVSVIKQNLLMWGVLNIIGFTLVFMGVLSPSGAAVYNFASDFLPIINSLSLFKR